MQGAMQGEESLLQLPHEQHQSYAATIMPNHWLRPGALQMHINYHKSMKQGLKNLGLYQMVEVHHCQIDKGLITALVERWRPETNSFHLPVGECTVTLEDVSCLWGLSVTGKAISGCTDDNWSQLIEDCLGHEVYDGLEWNDNDFYYKKVEHSGQPNEKISISQNYVRLVWLRTNFANTDLDLVDEQEDQEIINRHTRAYAMELFGTIMFPDANSSSVRLMYLQFLEDLGPRGRNYYNWGGAVLACLYRELSRACRYKANSINGPLLLLQMWSWTRFPIGRPRPHDIPFDNEPVDDRRAYGAKWTIPHLWEGNPYSGTSQFRSQFERLKSNVVNWMPYRDYQNIIHWHGIKDQEFFACRMWCIHFWEVEYHLPDRVFRQFGLFQAVPPLAPPPFSQLETIRKWTRGRGLHDDGTSVDWSRYFHQYIVSPPQNFAQRTQHGQFYPYLPDRYHEYMEWFVHHGMFTVFPRQDNEEILSQAVPEQEEDVANMGYVPDAMIQARLRFHHLKQTAKGISMVKTPGQKAYGLMMLENSRSVLSDLGQIALFTAMLVQGGLPVDIRNIDISTDFPDQFPREPRVEVPQTAMHDDMSDIFQSMRSIRIEGHTLGESGALRDGGAGPSIANPARRKKKPPNRYSDSKFRYARDREFINEDDDLV